MIKKKYFINVSFSNPKTSSIHIHKFAYAILKLDMGKVDIENVAFDMVKPICEIEGVDIDNVSINVTAFNRI
jgi:hypothetical protein